MDFSFDAFVVAAVLVEGGCAYALGDGSVVWSGGQRVQAHDGPVLAACAHPRGGVLTGGDDGRLMHVQPSGASAIAELGAGRWIERVAVSAASGLIAFAAGRELHVRDLNDPAFARVFKHERTVADLAFDAKGRRLATATYGGVHLWLARIADQKPTVLRFAGSHTATAFSPDGRYVVSAMQDNQVHGWRLADGKALNMGGYPAKVRSLSFMAGGALLATSGAAGAVVWPFTGKDGPMGKSASEIGAEEGSRVVIVAGQSDGPRLAAGTSDGRVWFADLTSSRRVTVSESGGAPISALALSDNGRTLAWGDESGAAGLLTLD